MCPLTLFFLRVHLLVISFSNERNPNHDKKTAAYSVGASFTPNIKQIHGDNFVSRLMHLGHNYPFKAILGHCFGNSIPGFH